MFTKDDLREAFEAGDERASWEIKGTSEDNRPPDFNEWLKKKIEASSIESETTGE